MSGSLWSSALQTSETAGSTKPIRLWRWRSAALLTAVWAVLQIGGLFTPGLLDDVDSVYLQIAREMLARHDFITPTIDGIRFFDKPPLMYWLAAGSMRLFGQHDWAGRLPLALAMLALVLATYALGLRLLRFASPPAHPDRAAFYAALALSTSLGPYLYTRFYIPDIVVALWMTLAVFLLLFALDRLRDGGSALLASLLFGAVLGLNVLTKGLIGLIFPLGFALLYVLWTTGVRGYARALWRLQPMAGTAAFLLVALPWHVLAAIRNPPIAMPAGVGLPARAGWAWFYLYNEHIARFLGRRIPHDYGQVPVPLFWLLLLLWLAPWAAFLPGGLIALLQRWRDRDRRLSEQAREALRVTLLWAGLILGFFTLSSRQEYYHLPALPALALLTGAWLAAAEQPALHPTAARSVYRASRWLLAPGSLLLAVVCLYFAITAPHLPAAMDLTAALSQNPALYNLSLGHIFDLTAAAMSFFRWPLTLTAFGLLLLGVIAFALRRRHAIAANFTIAVGMVLVLLAAHIGLVRFYPTLGSKDLADAIVARPALDTPAVPLALDGELTSAQACCSIRATRCCSSMAG